VSIDLTCAEKKDSFEDGLGLGSLRLTFAASICYIHDWAGWTDRQLDHARELERANSSRGVAGSLQNQHHLCKKPDFVFEI
jgi:hypothetical protein